MSCACLLLNLSCLNLLKIFILVCSLSNRGLFLMDDEIMLAEFFNHNLVNPISFFTCLNLNFTCENRGFPFLFLKQPKSTFSFIRLQQANFSFLNY